MAAGWQIETKNRAMYLDNSNPERCCRCITAGPIVLLSGIRSEILPRSYLMMLDMLELPIIQRSRKMGYGICSKHRIRFLYLESQTNQMGAHPPATAEDRREDIMS